MEAQQAMRRSISHTLAELPVELAVGKGQAHELSEQPSLQDELLQHGPDMDSTGGGSTAEEPIAAEGWLVRHRAEASRCGAFNPPEAAADEQLHANLARSMMVVKTMPLLAVQADTVGLADQRSWHVCACRQLCRDSHGGAPGQHGDVGLLPRRHAHQQHWCVLEPAGQHADPCCTFTACCPDLQAWQWCMA